MEVQHRERRILLVDDQPIVRQGLRQVIDREHDLTVSGEAKTADEAMQAIAERRPDLIIAEIAFSQAGGLQWVHDLRTRFPDIPLLVLSIYDESVYALRCLHAGASGYIMKREPIDRILTAIRRVLSGSIYLSDPMMQRLAEGVSRGRPGEKATGLDLLTDRELDVFRLIGEGYTTRQIAQKLHLSIKTVESYRERIKKKLGLRSGTRLLQAAVLWALSGQAPPSPR